jgi:hypothetical protein
LAKHRSSLLGQSRALSAAWAGRLGGGLISYSGLLPLDRQTVFSSSVVKGLRPHTNFFVLKQHLFSRSSAARLRFLNIRCGGQASANSGGFIPRKEKKKKRAAKNLRKLLLSLAKKNLEKNCLP